MADEKQIPEGSVETEQQVITKGKVVMSWKHPTSTKIRMICETIVGSNVALITLVSGSDLFTGFQSKAICFTLGAMAIIAGTFMKSTGVKPAE